MARPTRGDSFSCHPLTADRWSDFETLFGVRGACGGCWCMLWRLPRQTFEAQKGDGNRQALHALVDAGVVPGLLGYVGDVPAAWCSLQPRASFPYLARSRALRPIDDVPVWSVTCLFVDKRHRRKGLSIRILEAAIEHVRGQGGLVVEGYPIEPKKDDVAGPFAWTGLRSAFEKAGFTEAARGPTGRPIMRFTIHS